MNIHFPEDTPLYNACELRLGFPVDVDGQRLTCYVSAEALEDHFGARSPSEDHLMRSFALHRRTIQAAAERALRKLDGTAVVLNSGYFRFYLPR